MPDVFVTAILALMALQVPLMLFTTKLLWNINQRLAGIENETTNQKDRIKRLENKSDGFNRWKEKEA